MTNNFAFLGLVALMLVGCVDSKSSSAPHAVAEAQTKGEVGKWEIVSSEEYQARNPNEAAALAQRFPELFFNDDEMKSVDLEATHYKFTGPSRCPAGDSRLSDTVISMKYCTTEDSCGGHGQSEPKGDPCD